MFAVSFEDNKESKEYIEYLFGRKLELKIINRNDYDFLAHIVYEESEQFLGETIISNAIANNATDVHFEPYEEYVKIRYRVNGCLSFKFNIEKEIYNKALSKIKLESNMDITEKRKPQDGKVIKKYNNVRYDLRISTIPVIYGEKMVIRILYCGSFNKKLEDLQFNEQNISDIRKMMNISGGLFIVCGPTGSGKSTTLYTILKELSRKNINVVTLEDPVEVYLENVNQMSLNKALDITFGSGLRSILRQDPDVIMIGEIRDNETANMALRAAITGHKVYSTIHCRSPREVFLRLINLGVESEILIEAIKGIISQRLVKILCPHCKSIYNGKKYKGFDIYKHNGCKKCGYTGYSSRSMISSVYYINNSIKNIDTIYEDQNCLSNKTMKIQLEKMLIEGLVDYEDFNNFIEGEKLKDV